MVRIYVEGGGDHNPSLAHDVRQGFQSFFVKSGIKMKPRVIASGSRIKAYEDYCIAVKSGLPAMLLVDSEAPVFERFVQGTHHDWKPWEQLQSRKDQAGVQCDPWEKVGSDADCHLMVQMMETWFLADVDAMKAYFKGGFKANMFPNDDENIEEISKTRTEAILKASTAETKKEGYIKGRDSFIILSQVDPKKVRARSKWADRFLRLLTEKTEQTFLR